MQPEEIAATCYAIQAEYRDRLFAMKTRIRVMGALGAYIRSGLGWSPELTDKERKRISTDAAAIIKHGKLVFSEKLAPNEPVEWARFSRQVLLTLASVAPWEMEEAACKRRAEKLAKKLPVWDGFAKDILGLGPGGIATIIGEAGDLNKYDRESKLWKRMGVGVIGPGDGIADHRQGNPGPGATNQDWIAEGYNRYRRSRLYSAVAEPLLKCKEGPYRAIYDRRVEYEIARAEASGLTVAYSADIPKARRDEFFPRMAIHRRAHRYMEKRLLRHLWRAWRRQGLGDGALAGPMNARPDVPEIRQEAA